MKRLFLLMLFFWMVPGTALAAPGATISLQSPSSPLGAVAATSEYDLRYRIIFSEPVEGLTLEDFSLRSPSGTWNRGNLQSLDNQTWSVDVWRSAGGGSGEIELTLKADSVTAGGQTGPVEAVSGPVLRIDDDSPEGGDFSYEYFDGTDSFTWDSAALGLDWYYGQSWLEERSWADLAALGDSWVALEEGGDIWRFGEGDWSLDRDGEEAWEAVEVWQNRAWALAQDGTLISRGEAPAWRAEPALPSGQWIDLAGKGDRLYALAEDGGVQSFDGVSWSQERAAPGGTWTALAASGSSILALRGNGTTARLLRGAWQTGGFMAAGGWGHLLRGGGWWWAASDEGSLQRSRDGLDWSPVSLPATYSLLDIAFASGRIYLLGKGGVGVSVTRLLSARADQMTWSDQTVSAPALGAGPWQRLAVAEEAFLLGPFSLMLSAGAKKTALDNPPEFLRATLASDSSAWEERISRSSTSFQDGRCQADWQEDWSVLSSSQWPSEETWAEDSCYKYSRVVTDYAGNTERSGIVFDYLVPPTVSSFTRTAPPKTTLSRADVQSGITYGLVFSEPLAEGELTLDDFQYEGTASGEWSGELQTADRKAWTLRLSSENATSGTFWPSLKAGSVQDGVSTAGPPSNSAAASTTLDTEAPAAPTWSGDTPPAIRRAGQTLFQLEFQGEPGASFRCSLDEPDPSQVPANCESPRGFSVGEGNHIIRIWQQDQAGNLSEPLLYDFLVDTINPTEPRLVSSVISGSQIQSRSASLSWEMQNPDLGDFVECQWQSGNWEDCSTNYENSQFTPTELSDGQYSFRVRTRDQAGNASPEVGVSWTVDNIAPAAPIFDVESLPPAFSSNSIETISWDGEPGARSECRRLDWAGGSWTEPGWGSCTAGSFHQLSGLLSGKYAFQVRLVDQAGNESEAATTPEWEVILSEPPQPEITSGPATLTSSRSATFSFRSSEDHTFLCLIDGSWQECESPVVLQNLTDGPRTFQVRQRNAAGTEGPAALWSWTVDGTPPSRPEVDSKPPLWTPASVASFAWRGDFNTTSRCQLNGAPWSDCSSIWELSGLGEGQQVFRLRSRDQAGNESEIWEHRWTVDRTPPEAPRWTAGPEGPAPELQSVFAWSGEAGADFQCSLDGQPWDACISPLTLRFAVAGEHTLRVRQIDRAGNVSQPASRSWSIDLEDPSSPEIIDSPGRWTKSDWVSFSWLGERGNTFQCSLDGGAWQRCSSPHEYSGTAPGSHTFRVRQVRPSGRAGAPASWRWGRDVQSPRLQKIVVKIKRGRATIRTRAKDQGGSGLSLLQLRPGKTYPIKTKKAKIKKMPRQARVCDQARNCSAWVRVAKK